MKRLTGLFILAAMMLVFTLTADAGSDLSFEYQGGYFSVEQAAQPESGFPFNVENKDGVLVLSDTASGLSALIRHETLDEASLAALKKYYNTYEASDFELFEKFVELQKSYLPVMQDLYRMHWQFGNPADQYSESNMKVYYQNMDVIFGNISDVILYNTYYSDRQGIDEETHLDLIIPVYRNLSLININFTYKAGSFDETAKAAIDRLLKSLRLPGLPVQNNTLKVFTASEAVDASNAGIYKSGSHKADTLLELRNDSSGYMLKYPSSYLPYMENGLGGKLDYKSYKISPNHVFSVSAEETSIPEAVYGKPAYVKEFYGEKLADMKESRLSSGDREFIILDYEIEESPGMTSYIRECFTSGKRHIYSLRLSSRHEYPSAELSAQFEEILKSFRELDSNALNNRIYNSMTKYISKDKGYSFLYPLRWKLTDKSGDTGFDSFSLKIPELSGPIDISISEGRLKSDIPVEALPRILFQAGLEDADDIIENYNPPYGSTVYRLLSHSSLRDKDATYVFRLLNYLDAGGRPRLCYSIDIIKDSRVHSMFISVSEYSTLKGIVQDTEINRIINNIAASFKSDDAPDTGRKGYMEETGSLKVVRLEGLLRKQLGHEVSIVQTVSTKDNDIYYVMVEGIEESGIYKVRLDNGQSTVFIENKLLSKDCEAYFEDILFTDVKITFAPGDDLFNIEEQRAENGHYFTAVYAEFGDNMGFAILDIDPHGQIIDVISFKSSSILAEEISARIAQNAESGFIIDYCVDKKLFTLNLHFYSTAKGHFFKSYRLALNPATQSLICTEE